MNISRDVTQYNINSDIMTHPPLIIIRGSDDQEVVFERMKYDAAWHQ